MILVDQVSGLVENVNVGIFSDTGNVINVIHIELTCSLHFSNLDIISRPEQYPTVLNENFVFLFD